VNKKVKKERSSMNKNEIDFSKCKEQVAHEVIAYASAPGMLGFDPEGQG
jgi:hypothetical protein